MLYTKFEWSDWETGLLYWYTQYVLFGTDTAPDPVYSIGCKHTLAGFYTVLLSGFPVLVIIEHSLVVFPKKYRRTAQILVRAA